MTNHPVVVDELCLDDDLVAGEVHRLGRRAYALEAELIGFDGIPALTESLAEMRSRPLRWLGATGARGEIQAFVAWEVTDAEPRIQLDRVCVEPRLVRRGLASLLLGHLLAEHGETHVVTVSTGAANVPAIALYEHLGFTRTRDHEAAPGLVLADLTRRARGAGSG